MESEIITLNTEGEVCPYPIIKCLKKFEEIKKDIESGTKTLVVITDHSSAMENIPSELKKRGVIASVENLGSAKWKIIVKK